MRRRQFLTGAALLAGSAALVRSPASAAGAEPHAIPHLLDPLLSLPGQKGAQIDVDEADNPWRVTYKPNEQLFCGSCFKTFVLAAYMQEVEEGRQDEHAQLAIDDSVRTASSSVFGNLSGTTMARNALEAMIAHSDNTGTDVIMQRVGAERVRAFVNDAGLAGVRIPDSTRRFFSYVAGAPAGEDMGWKALSALLREDKPDASKFRPALNDVETMAAPAADFVSYYKRALAGEFFSKPETLVEFKRILAMADSIAIALPPDTPAFMKGGSIDWNGFYCMASAGQMIVRGVPVTFALTLNWTDSDGDAKKITADYIEAVKTVLGKVNTRLLEV